MGEKVKAKCECGVEAAILIGGGMNNFMTTCFFPCLCENCHNIVQVNLLAKPMRCPKCQASNPIPYDDPRLCESPGNNIITDWNMQGQFGRKLELTDGKYECPKCGKMSLEFVHGRIYWD